MAIAQSLSGITKILKIKLVVVTKPMMLLLLVSKRVGLLAGVNILILKHLS